MSDNQILEPSTDAHADARSALFARLEELTAEEGHFESVGARHWAFFEDVGTTLFVTFEDIATILAAEDGMPSGHAIAKARGWSHLCFVSDGPTWFRDPAIYRHIDRLVDDTFFEDFDQVLFYGQGSGAHAACAFAVAAPGAHVLAISPPASLSGREVIWDRRHMTARRMDFSSRYGYAPAMLEGAGKVVVLHDLTVAEEAMHSALFRAPWVTRLTVPLMAGRIEWALQKTGVLPEVIDLAMAGKLTPAAFGKLWRKRRAFAPYLEALLNKAEANRRPALAITICQSVTRRLKAPRFQRRLAKLTGETKA
jgi:hypothetical protein